MTAVHHWKEMGRGGVRSRDTEEKDTRLNTPLAAKKIKITRNLEPNVCTFQDEVVELHTG